MVVYYNQNKICTQEGENLDFENIFNGVVFFVIVIRKKLV